MKPSSSVRPVPAKEDLPRREVTYDKPTAPGTSLSSAHINERPLSNNPTPVRPVVEPRQATPVVQRREVPLRKDSLDVPDFVAFSDQSTPTYTGISLGEDEIVKIDDN
jgi:hypothetical protein